LSLILCSRNDEYMGDSRWRLQTTLNYLGDRVQALGYGHLVEVLVADWGSDVPLRDVVQLEPPAAAIVSFVTIPPSVARERQGDSPFPEVLALNAAARRARGEYIGRIDQDTLVGARFLRRFFDGVTGREPWPVPPDTALFFANRRNIPFRFASRRPDRRQVDTFLRLFGTRLPVWRRNPWFGDEFWASYVGLWLAHRARWEECGGYDERMIYYNWMEADMIRRLRQRYPVVDLGRLTGHDFYHLEHYSPRAAAAARAHSRKNADVEAAGPVPALHPNGADWGLAGCDLPVGPCAAMAVPAVAGTGPAAVRYAGAFTGAMIRLAAEVTTDRVAVLLTRGYAVGRRRVQAASRGLAGQPVVLWPGTLWKLWRGQKANRVR
jgi:hypothetical protein